MGYSNRSNENGRYRFYLPSNDSHSLYRGCRLRMEEVMNAIIFCTAVAMNIFSMPAGNTIVGGTFLGERVQIQDTSLMRDWVFIGEPGFELGVNNQQIYTGVKSMGWVAYAGLVCQ